MLAAASALAAIGWQPEIRGALVVLIAVVVLCGSIYMILATNSGPRLGFSLAFTGLAGWMLIMGIIWSMYGIGLKGSDPSWQPTEILVGDTAFAETAVARDLSSWRALPEGNGDRGEAQAVVDELLAAADGPNKDLVSDADGNYLGAVTENVYDIGGKDARTDDSMVGRVVYKLRSIAQLRHPIHYAAVQFQRAKPVPSGFVGKLEPDSTQPVVTVVMTRDLGNKRFPPMMVTLASLVAFALGVLQLNRRDRLATEARAAAGLK